MCPLWPFHILLLYALMLFPLWLVCFGSTLDDLKGTFYPSRVPEHKKEISAELVEGVTNEIVFEPAVPINSFGTVEVILDDYQIAEPLDGNKTLVFNTTATPRNISFFLTGKFLGHTKVSLKVSDGKNVNVTTKLPVSVVRPKRVVDDVFIICVALLVGLNYINMGCTIDLDIVKSTIKKPIGPAVGLISQFLFMPLVSFGLSEVIFTSPNMRLGLFTVGCSPGGGASNMWTHLLGGNLNLSITMTFISNVVAFAMMPAWLFTLGRLIFTDSKINIPYTNIVTSLVALVIPVGIGLLIQRYFPKAAKMSRRMLGWCNGIMILFIVIFGTFANLYMFQLFDWRVVLGGLGVPWLGYAFGAGLAKLAKFSLEDILAIAVETGIQNTGIAIILLRFSLPQPDADLTSVIPVAAALMMPIPLTVIFIILRLRKRAKGGGKDYQVCKADGSSSESADSNLNISKTSTYANNGTNGTNGTANGTGDATNGTNDINVRYNANGRY